MVGGTSGANKIKSSLDVKIPNNPIDMVIGQERAKEKAVLCARQHRHLLLIGPPGTGKSMIAQAMASLLPKPRDEIWIVDNKENPERPLIEVVHKEGKNEAGLPGTVISPYELPFTVAERLGYRCHRCASLSDHNLCICPNCGAEKYAPERESGVPDLLSVSENKVDKIEYNFKGKPHIFIRENKEDTDIRAIPKKEWPKYEKIKGVGRKLLVPIDRKMFVQTSGLNETELLGDVKHDPYGSHPKIGTPVYKRVIPGAVHEAHEGVLFIDELSVLGEAQKYILTAMQDKKFPITGRNPTSSGASVRVDGVPCDFVLAAAANVNDVDKILPALRSRILGNGYEVLMDTAMPENEENKHKLYQFIAQEIKQDGKIPPMDTEGMNELVEYARKIAREIDNTSGYTLRLRILSGVIRAAGDSAILDNSKYITKEHVQKGIKESISIEKQLDKRYSNWYAQSMSDKGY